MDGRNLNYSKYFTKGDVREADLDDYTSQNTRQLSVPASPGSGLDIVTGLILFNMSETPMVNISCGNTFSSDTRLYQNNRAACQRLRAIWDPFQDCPIPKEARYTYE